MILTCTSCATRYYADDAAIGPSGRTVRCAACSHEWFVEPQLVLGETAQKPEPLTRERVERMRRAADMPGPAPSAAARYRQQQADRMRRERARVAVVAWGATGAALAASTAGAVMFRQDVAELWPRSASAFAAVGLDVNVYGLEFEDVAVERAFEGPTPVLLVSGEIRNIGRDDKDAPPVRITLRDDHSNELYEVIHVVDAGSIAAGASAPFQIRVENPPADAVDLETTFASLAEAAAQPQRVAPPPSPAATPTSTIDAPLVLGPPQELTDEEGHSLSQNSGPIDGLAPRFSSETVGGA